MRDLWLPLVLLILTAAMCHDAWADDLPACQREDGPGLCLGREQLATMARARADLEACEDHRRADTEALVEYRAALDASATLLAEQRARVEAMRRRRWRWVALGAVGGVALSGLTVYAGVQVVEARR